MFIRGFAGTKLGTTGGSASVRFGVDEAVVVPKEISSGSKMAKKKQPLHGLRWGEAVLGPSGEGSRVTCRPDWGFLALYQRGKAKSGGSGDGSVTVARGRRRVCWSRWRRYRRYPGCRWSRRRRRRPRSEGSVAHGLVSTCTPVSPSPCGGRIGVFTYIESLPTYNYRLPILRWNSWLPACSPRLLHEPQCQIHEARVMLPRSA